MQDLKLIQKSLRNLQDQFQTFLTENTIMKVVNSEFAQIGTSESVENLKRLASAHKNSAKIRNLITFLECLYQSDIEELENSYKLIVTKSKAHMTLREAIL